MVAEILIVAEKIFKDIKEGNFTIDQLIRCKVA